MKEESKTYIVWRYAFACVFFAFQTVCQCVCVCVCVCLCVNRWDILKQTF